MALKVEFEDDDLDRLETDREFTAGRSEAIVRAFRKTMYAIRAAQDERDFYAVKSFHFEKLSRPRDHQHSFRLNKQWRLIVELRGEHPNKRIAIIAIEDYH
jgi:toxin HigB-1